MVDISQFTIAKSDQLNADDLRHDGRLSGPITVKITRVTGTGDKEQPIAIYYDGDGGRPYKPGKSMRRVLKAFWGKETDVYPGRWITLYCDATVEFGGLKVGGVRISHMSDVDETTTAIPATRGAKRRYDVKRLDPPEGQSGGGAGGQQRRKRTPAEQVDAYVTAIGNVGKREDGSDDLDGGLTALAEYQADEARAKWRAAIETGDAALFDRVVAAEQARFRELSGPVENEVDGGGAGGPAGGDDDDEGFPA